MENLTPKELQRATENFLNAFCTGGKEEEFIKEMSKAHPTLQQNYTRFVMKWIKEMDSKEYFDSRNEASVNLCGKIMRHVEDDMILPTI